MKVHRISKEDLKRKLDKGEELTIIDVRKPKDYDKSDVKLPGAIRIPLDEMDFRADELDPEMETITYCA
jgi:rhodanese-related sulfurtransferase